MGKGKSLGYYSSSDSSSINSSSSSSSSSSSNSSSSSGIVVVVLTGPKSGKIPVIAKVMEAEANAGVHR